MLDVRVGATDQSDNPILDDGVWGEGDDDDYNEHETSLTKEHRDGYYFYLVFVDSGGKPTEVLAVLTQLLYPQAELTPSSYEVRFDRQHLDD